MTSRHSLKIDLQGHSIYQNPLFPKLRVSPFKVKSRWPKSVHLLTAAQNNWVGLVNPYKNQEI